VSTRGPTSFTTASGKAIDDNSAENQEKAAGLEPARSRSQRSTSKADTAVRSERL
jgi:hypothetical protein